ncbi:hypothetical protein P2H44_21815 [Albimonas sp. CAU 1670]|uniref:hypothetical protein n=1 Tax=Albimonas sp. CAU 1670 TaxID=3032599 RepID=UPI0023DB0ED1|nr:hypothetical protein [Albimonas sp. CAU 1670]MDF2235203.1 hypothetical protein [Albimonas sp. CAU 1670]
MTAIALDARTDALPSLPSETLERLALAVSTRLRGRLAAAERRLAGERLTEDARRLLEDQAAELEWSLTRIDLHVAIARDRRGATVDLDPAMHALLTADGKLAAFPGAARRAEPLSVAASAA